MLHELWNCLHWPFCPGVFIAVLAFVAAAVAFRVEKASTVEKATWTFVFLLLVVGEIWMMGIDRRKHDKEQAEARAEQLRQFQGIADGINASIDAEKRHFDTTMSSMKRLIKTANNSLNQVTGNGQFCYLEPIPVPGRKNGKTVFSLAVMNSGPLPLEVCDVIVFGQDPANPMSIEQKLGPLPPGRAKENEGNVGEGTNITVTEGSYYIEINTRNDRFYENMELHQPQGKQELATIEVRRNDSTRKLVYAEPPAKPDAEKTRRK